MYTQSPQQNDIITPPVRETVAIMCCGQGSVWPHMGRELYDTFPAARAAMDSIAAIADWDILGLMDEDDIHTIGLTRWQQPYLFFLEFAQASYLTSLSFTPQVMSGHSLGELIGLSLAGVCSPEQSWEMINIRAQLTADLEAKSDADNGMMAMYGTAAVLEETLKLYPDIIISNYNSPTQYILSGPRKSLTEARRHLRKNKIPAILLNVTMAFHHPHMRVIRTESLKHLHRMDFVAPTMPMLSNVTTGLYPPDKEGICQYIADLDENCVRWVECVRNMWHIHHVRHFVELGPADTLCGLTAEICPEAVCIAINRKNKEAEGMRDAVARLRTLGHIPTPAHRHGTMPEHDSAAQPTTGHERPTAPASSTVPVPAHIEDIMPLIMEATGYAREALSPDMDLRHDLAIRSSRFPAIMHTAEEKFSIDIGFEDLMDVVTIKDLADSIARLRTASPLPVDTKPLSAPPAIPQQEKCAIDERPSCFPSVYPIHYAYDPPCFIGGHDFSHYADAALVGQHTIPPVLYIRCLEEAAAQPAAWLHPIGMDNVDILQDAACPLGITRHSRIHMQAQTWHMQPVDTTILPWNGFIEIQDITHNGRRTHTWTTVCRGNVMLAAHDLALQPLWREQEAATHIVKKNPALSIAVYPYSRYAVCSFWIELFFDTILREQGEHWRVRSFQALRHNGVPQQAGPIRLEWREVPCINEGLHIKIFDVQARDDQGNILATLHNMQCHNPCTTSFV